jgi:biotin carboxylase
MSHLLMIESWVGGTGRILPQAVLAAGHRYTFVTRRPEHYAAAPDGTPHPVLAHAARVLTLDTNDAAALEAALRRHHAEDPFDGALGICDYYLDAIVQVAVALGVPHPFPAGVAAERRKHWVRRALDEAGIPNVRHALTRGWEATRDAARALGYPLVSKPTDLASSAHVRRVGDERELRDAFAALEGFERNFRDQPRDRHVLLEEYLEGPEVSVEACTIDGQTVVLGVTDKGVTGAPFFVEDSHMFPAALEPGVARALDDYARRVLAAVKHDRGFAHLEVKLTAAGPRLVELNPRLPGNYIVELVQRVTGVDLLAGTIELALGRRPSLAGGSGSVRSAAIHFIIPPSGGVLRAVLGAESLARDPHVARHELDATPGARVAEPIDNGCYLGHVVAIDPDGLSARRFAEAAARRLEVVLEH